MDDFEAAGIIDQAFPKHPLFLARNVNIQVNSLSEALAHARTKCGNNTIDFCIQWARKYLHEFS